MTSHVGNKKHFGAVLLLRNIFANAESIFLYKVIKSSSYYSVLIITDTKLVQ